MGGTMELKHTTPEVKLVDKAVVGRRFSASAASYDRYAIAQRHIYERLEALLAQEGRRSYERVLEIGCGTAGLSKYLDARYEVGHWTLNDLGGEMIEHGHFVPRLASRPSLILGDAEQIDLGTGYDLILSASAIQWFHDPGGFVRSLWSRLRPGGILLMSTFGLENLIEIKRLTGQGLHYHTLTEIESWVAEYRAHHVEDEVYPLCFGSPREVLLHLKRTGVTGTAARPGFWSVERLKAFERAYIEQYSQSDGSIRLSYHPVYILAHR